MSTALKPFSPGANTHSAGFQIAFALDLFIPMAMAYLTLVLKDAANRRTNTVLGALAVAGGISALIDQPGQMSAAVDFVVVVAILVALLIVWYARKWPRPAEVTPSRPSQETKRREHEVSAG
jgi:peptidoglycan/LPS O-acetylase OafA/YrhL